MHEMSLMSSIFDIINSTIEEYQPRKVNKITLKVGELTNALPEALEMAFEVFSKGNIVEGATLEILRIPIKVYCSHCDSQSILEDMIYNCPCCQSIGVEVIEGRELQIESIEVD